MPTLVIPAYDSGFRYGSHIGFRFTEDFDADLIRGVFMDDKNKKSLLKAQYGGPGRIRTGDLRADNAAAWATNRRDRFKKKMVPQGGIEPPTRGFSVLCSTD